MISLCGRRITITAPLWALILSLVLCGITLSFSGTLNLVQASISQFALFGPQARGLDDDTNVRLPSRANGSDLSPLERLRYLELKVNGFMNWAKDPLFGV